MGASVFNIPEVENWVRNCKNGLEKLFWDDAIYHFTHVYDSFEPFMRLCVDLMIEGKTPKEIAEMTGKPYGAVRVTIHRAKKRIKEEIF